MNFPPDSDEQFLFLRSILPKLTLYVKHIQNLYALSTTVHTSYPIFILIYFSTLAPHPLREARAKRRNIRAFNMIMSRWTTRTCTSLAPIRIRWISGSPLVDLFMALGIQVRRHGFVLLMGISSFFLSLFAAFCCSITCISICFGFDRWISLDLFF